MELNIVSWNILNHTIPNLKILLKNKYLNNKQIKTIVKKEHMRYEKIIQSQILRVIKLLSNNTIIFLQEVDQYMLNQLKKSYDLIYYTITPDINLIDYTSKVEHRVIILPNIFKNFNNNIKEIKFENDYSIKNGLMLTLKSSNMNIVLINIHFHWKSTVQDLEKYAEKIYGEIKKSFIDISKLKIIISGDFNKSIKKVENFFVKMINYFSNSQISLVNNYTANNDYFTSHSTDKTESNEFDIIDHILTSNIKSGQTEIINQIDNILIFKKAQDLIRINLENDLSETNYLSDHKIIKLEVKI